MKGNTPAERTEWGVSTRLAGALVMTHGDDDGLMLPPRLSPAHVAILPIIRNDEVRGQVMEYCEKLAGELADVQYDGQAVRVELDARDLRGGDKLWSWIKKGVPLRVEVGPRDIAEDSLCVARRDRSAKDRENVSRREFVATIARQLDEIQQTLFQRARTLRNEHTHRIDSKKEFYDFFTPGNRDKPEIHGGFASSHFSGDPDVENTIKKDLNVTVRCIPFDAEEEAGTCVISGRPSTRRVIFAKAY